MESTHHVAIDARSVRKRFVSAERGEAEREWRALQLLTRFAPDLAPVPLEFHPELPNPMIVMSRLPGTSLGITPLTSHQIEAAATAMKTLHQAIPQDELRTLPPRISGGRDMVCLLQRVSVDEDAAISDIATRALAAGSEWVHSAAADELAQTTTPVFARGDGNLANLVWDGRRCRIVDFEDSGSGDLAYEVADFVEHVSVGMTGVLDTERFLDQLRFPDHEGSRLLQARRLMALFWLHMLLPGGRGYERNPPGSADRQAERLLRLLDDRP